MKKLLLILVLILLFGDNSYADKIEQRLSDIENRLKNIEQSLEGLDKLMLIFDNPNANFLDLFNKDKRDNNETSRSINSSKIKFETRKLYCSEGDFTSKIYLNYLLYNNYDKGIKYIDASIKVKDLFDETLLKASILKNAQVGPKDAKFFKSSIDDTFSDSCSKLAQAEYEDYKYEFNVLKIAFEDNSVIEFD